MSGSFKDIFEARIFHATHPDGSPVESYILTSEAGAERLRARAADHGLADLGLGRRDVERIHHDDRLIGNPIEESAVEREALHLLVYLQ